MRHPGAASAGTAGLALAALSAMTFGTSGTFATSLLNAGWSPGAAVTTRVLLAALALTIPGLLALRRSGASLRRGARSITIYGLVAIAGCQLTYFNAVQHVSVAVALLMEYSGILLVVGWLWVRHGHRPGRLTAAGAVAAVMGLVLVLDLIGAHHIDPVGLLWGLGAAAGLAVYFVISADQEQPLPPLVVAWGGMVVGGVGLLALGLIGVMPLKAPRVDVTLVHARVSWLVPVLGLAVVAAAIAYVAGIAAARLLGAKLASFVGLLEVLFAVTFAWIGLGQSLSPVQIAGGALVVLGIALVRVDEMRAPTPRPAGRVAEEPARELVASGSLAA